MAAETGATTSRLLNRLAYDIANKATSLTGANSATGDQYLVYDASAEELKVITRAEQIVAMNGGTAGGTVVASSAVVVDANKDISAFRNVTATNYDAGASGTAGSVDVFPATASKGKLAITVTDQTGDTTVSLVAGAMAAARTITLRDPGAAASILTTTDGTAAATAATAVEITNACDVSARMVAAGGTLAMVEGTHQGKIIALDTAAGSVVTLPASTGGGAVYKFLVTVTATSNSHVIKVANASDEFRGYVVQDASEATAPNIWWAADNDDTITLNRTTTGLAAQGEYFEIVDAVLNHFFVRGYSQASGTEATPFSATV